MLRLNILIVLLCAVLAGATITPAKAHDAVITVNVASNIGPVNRMVFGSNLLGYDPAIMNKKPYYGHCDYGAGMWDPETSQPAGGCVRLAREAGITVVRFPGGNGAQNYDWKRAVGPGREHNLFGIDEFIATAAAINATPVITIGYFSGNAQDAADLVEYLNSPDDATHVWAAYRAKNGHKEPYGVKYFEFDNETWHGDTAKASPAPTPQEYARRYLLYREAMKTVDPGIQLGAVLLNIGYNDKYWDREVIHATKGKADFFITHDYPPHFSNKKLYLRTDTKNVFAISLAYPVTLDRDEFDAMNALINEASQENSPGIAVSEFNAYLVQDSPEPPRHSLGSALVNAELIQFFLDPENNIFMANNWNFSNEYWGMVANGFKGDPASLHNSYYKRPNYFVFQMYHEHFGDVLIGNSVQCPSYHALGESIPYLSVCSSRSLDGGTVSLMVINKNMDSRIRAVINLKDFDHRQTVKAWVLNGPAIDSTNELIHDTVGVSYGEFPANDVLFEYTFEPHSLTALEFTVKGR